MLFRTGSSIRGPNNIKCVHAKAYVFANLFQELDIQFCHCSCIPQDAVLLKSGILAVANELTDLCNLVCCRCRSMRSLAPGDNPNHIWNTCVWCTGLH